MLPRTYIYYCVHAEYIGVTSSVIVELWAVREGLKLVLDSNIESIHIETNSQCAYHIIHKN